MLGVEFGEKVLSKTRPAGKLCKILPRFICVVVAVMVNVNVAWLYFAVVVVDDLNLVVVFDDIVCRGFVNDLPNFPFCLRFIFHVDMFTSPRLYLVALENLIKEGLTNRKRGSKVNADSGDEEEEEARLSRQRNLAFLAVKCMSELLVAHPHFNYR